MDRVNIPGEAPGSATYYMGFAPEEYGTRLYEMEYYGDAVIRSALMDIGSQRTQPYQTISSSREYEDLVWKSKGRTIYSCRFEVTYKEIDVTVEPDFETKRLTLQIDPACKSGVILREAAKRFIKGLEKEIPNLQERINHIYQNQLFGIGITELTSLLSRRR